MTENSKSWQQNTTFNAHSQADWRSNVDKLLAGADFNSKLVSRTFDNIKIQPLYQQLPDAPFLGRGESPWSIQQCYEQGQLDDVNRQILADLSGGVTSVELKLATTDHTSKSRPSLNCHSADELQQLLSGVHAEMIQLSLTPGTENRLTGALLLAYYYRQKIAPESVRCALNIDPLKTQAETGQCSEGALQTLEQYASYCANQFPAATSLSVDSSVYHNAGCTEAQELAYSLSTTIEYLRTLTTLDADTAFKQMRHRVALDSDFFLNVAKLRAIRELLKQVQLNCGATQPSMRIDAVSGSRALTTLDSAVNILRIGTQTAAAMTGGANGFNCTSHDCLTNNSEQAQRIARNTHHVLIEESGLLNVDDPTRGSGYIEGLTKELCESAWKIFQQIESEGGMQQTLSSGLIAQQIDQSCQQRALAMSTGDTTMIGVTEFPNSQETPVKEKFVQRVEKISKSDEASTELPSISVPALISALSEGESTLTYQNRFQPQINSIPLVRFRDAERFEALRLKSHNHNNKSGTTPEVTLLTVGSQKDYAPRAGFCKNFFAVAGIQTNIETLADVINSDQKLQNRNKLTVLCSSDELVIQEAATILSLNKTENLWVAGNNPKVLKALEDQVTEQIHLRCDKVSILEKALAIIGVSA